VHRQIIVPPHDKKFEAKNILREKQRIPSQFEIYVPSNNHLIIHNVLNIQLNDRAYLWCDVNLRQMYDLLVLSTKENPNKVLVEFAKYKHLSNAYLATLSLVFNAPDNIEFKNDLRTNFFLNRLSFFLRFPGTFHFGYKSIIYIIWRFSRYIGLPIQAIFRKEVRDGLWFRLSDREWYKAHVLSYWTYFKPASNN
jgi:hypothetical protein